jgi:hypothetical protein
MNNDENIEMENDDSETFRWLLRQCTEILKKEEIKMSLKEQYTNLVKIIFSEINVYIYVIIIIVFMIFLILIIILLILVICIVPFKEKH